MVGVALEEKEADAVRVQAAEHVGAGRGGESSEFENAGNGLGAEKEEDCSEQNCRGRGNEKRAVQRNCDGLRGGIGSGRKRGSGSRQGGDRRRLDFNSLNRPQETVAATGEGFDVGGLIGGIREGLAKFVDGFVEAVFEIHKRFGGPEALLNIVAGDDGSGMLEQHDKDFEGLAGETQLDAMLAKLACGDIHFEGAEAEEECGLGLDGASVSNKGWGNCIARGGGTGKENIFRRGWEMREGRIPA